MRELAKAGEYSMFVDALKKAGMMNDGVQMNPLTFFAPTNDAFRAVPKEMMEMLMKDKK